MLIGKAIYVVHLCFNMLFSLSSTTAKVSKEKMSIFANIFLQIKLIKNIPVAD